MSILRVALDVPLPKLFDYALDGANAALIGRRVVVPFGRGRRVGLVVDVVSTTEVDPARLKSAESILDDLPALPAAWLDLARFAADYYQRPLGEVIHAALPPRLRRPTPLRRAASAFEITDLGRSALGTLPARSTAKRTALARLLAEGPLAATALGSSATTRTLLAHGWIAPAQRPRPPLVFAEPYALLPAQRQAVDAIVAALQVFRTFLLLGVTGSGKTEVYLHVIATALARGRQALVLVPEINLTPQLEAHFRERFPGTPMTVLTSARADVERAEGWLDAQSGAARIVLGTRLAVFAPMHELGVVIVDEEQDASFKQQEGVRYSARDLAVYRAHAAKVPVVLGSATPSLESFGHARSGRYTLLELPERAHPGARLPEVRMIDLRTEPAPDGLAPSLVSAIADRLARDEQTLVFLNRRGYAPVLACGACGWASGCPRCAAHLVVHLRDREMRCHHCGLVAPIPRHCPQCGNVDLAPFGRGTQRVEEALADRFPQARCLRIDSDSTRNKGTWDAMRARIAAGDADILLGTQILAKGHDFPSVTLVGVLNADAGLLAADYRAPERLFAQLYQVAGRAGRGNRPGEVLIQTRYPDHPLYRAIAAHDYAGFADRLLAERRDAGFPPYMFEVVLRAEADALADALAFLRRASDTAPADRSGLTVYDPVPMSMHRLGGLERAQVLVQSPSRGRLQAFLHEWTATLYATRAGPVRWHLDVDPIEF